MSKPKCPLKPVCRFQLQAKPDNLSKKRTAGGPGKTLSAVRPKGF
jgi:hypothetical protein